MSYSITQVAKIAGITTRTLRYYDEIGLLKPIPSNDHTVRQYSKKHLLKLQSILLYREMAMPLSEINEIINAPTFNQIASICNHKMALKSKLSRLKTLINTIDHTLDHLTNDIAIEEIELFTGLQHEEQVDVKAILLEHLGELGEKIIDHQALTAKTVSRDDLKNEVNMTSVIFDDFLLMYENALDADSPQAQNWFGQYVQRVKSAIADLSNEDILKLVEMETSHPQLKKRMDQMHPKLAGFFLAAAKYYFKN